MIDILKQLIAKNFGENEPKPVVNGIVGKSPNFLPILGQKPDKKITFIDGGNCTLILTPNFIASKVRIGVYNNEKKRHDYDVLGFYDNGWKALVNEELWSLEKNSVSENGRINLEKIPQIIRRILELKYAQKTADFVVLDGTFDANFLEEKNLLKKMEENVVFLSKTNSIKTEKGNGYTSQLNLLRKQPFICKPYDNISFIKFQKSNYVFRLDGVPNPELLMALQENSSDAYFHGYPYGLVVADQLARISDEEKRMLKMELLAKLDSNELRALLAGTDAHDVLDMQKIY